MAGKFCAGRPTEVTIAREARAYCDGREAAAGGALKSTNPHVLGGRYHAIWDDGWDSWTANPAGLATTRDCCAHPYGGGYTP